MPCCALRIIASAWLHIDQDSPADIKEDSIAYFANDLKVISASTEQLYIIAVKGFFEYLTPENLTSINLPKLKLLIRQRTVVWQEITTISRGSDIKTDRFDV